MVAFNSVEDRAVVERHLLHALAGAFHGLAHGSRNFTALAGTHAHGALAVTGNSESSESKNAAALNNLGDAVHRDHLFANAVINFFGGVLLINLSHKPRFLLELEAGFARGLGQRGNAAVVTITGTVESAGFDSGSLRLLSQTGADDLSSGDIAAVAVDHGTNFSFSRGGAHQNAIAGSRNDAGIDVQVGAVHRKTIHLLQLDAGASSTGAAQAVFLFVNHFSEPRFTSSWFP